MKKLIISIVLAILLVIALPVMVFAIDDPDDPPRIDAAYVYEDCLEDGDIGILVAYYIDYTIAGTPTEPVSDAYFIQFIDTDGTTQLGSVAPYAYEDNGYQRGYAWIYFTAAEVTALGIDSTDKALYTIRCAGNPTIPSGWVGDPPVGEGGITMWYSASTLLAYRVLLFSQLLNIDWTPIVIVETSTVGNILTTEGIAYWTNVIPNLRTIAPNCFADRAVTPTIEDIDYSTGYSAVATTGTTVVAGSPDSIVADGDTITVNNTGTFTITLGNGTYGTIEDGTATITSSPSNLVPGVNTITVTGGALPGTLTVTVNLATPGQVIADEIAGTGFDLTAVATIFSMSRITFSTLVWLVVTILLCSATYYASRKAGGLDNRGAAPITMLMAVITLIGGALLGFVDHTVVAVVAVGYSALIGYIIFFRTSADIGRTVMFMGWVWLCICLIGGTMAGTNPQTSTYLTADVSAVTDTITVASTANFPESGVIVLDDERIFYTRTTDTTFTDTFWRPMIRGYDDTEAVIHTETDTNTGRPRLVRTVENAMLNNSFNYTYSLISDAAGWALFFTVPIALWNMITNFMLLPISFLGTNMQILLYVWGVIVLGLVVSLVVAIIGGRRV